MSDQLPAVAEKPRRITHKVRRSIDALVAGDARRSLTPPAPAGLSREHLSRELSKPHVATFLQQKVSRALAMASARAGATKVELLDSPSEHVRNQASSFVLGVAGIRPATSPSVSLNIEVKAGYIIDLSEPGETIDAKVIPHG